MNILGIIDADGDGIPDIVQHMPGDGGDIVDQCPYQPGSAKAQAWWMQVQEHANAEGTWFGKPLQPGQHPGDGDFQFLVDKLRITRGLDAEHAANIVAKVKGKLYG